MAGTRRASTGNTKPKWETDTKPQINSWQLFIKVKVRHARSTTTCWHLTPEIRESETARQKGSKARVRQRLALLFKN